MFRANPGDSLGGTNFLAYQQVGKIGRHLLSSLGRGNMAQAFAVEGVIDSLGLDSEVCVDITMPHFALIMVRNPFSDASPAAACGVCDWDRWAAAAGCRQ